MNKNIILTVLLMFIALNIVSAMEVNPSDIAYVFKNTESINIKNPCFYNGTFCSMAATCRITVYDPSGSIKVDNVLMTNQNSFHNYTLPGPYPLGVYKSDMVCTDHGVNGAQTFYFQVNSTGDRINNLALFLVLSIGAIVMLILAIAIGNEYLGFMAGALFVVAGVYALIYGISDLANLYTRSIGFISIGLGTIFLVAAGYSVVADAGLFSKVKDETDYFDTE